MKSLTISALLITAVTMTSGLYGEFFYGLDGPIPLTVDSNKVLISLINPFH